MRPAQRGSLVPPAGFEPAISTLKGWRPGPLDDGGPCAHRGASYICILGQPRRPRQTPGLTLTVAAKLSATGSALGPAWP